MSLHKQETSYPKLKTLLHPNLEQTMVRLKTRWLLVRIVTSDDGKRSTSGSSGPSPNYDVTKKELAKSIKESLEQCFGVAASAAALDLQGMSSSWPA
jgi:hypothetical protein